MKWIWKLNNQFESYFALNHNRLALGLYRCSHRLYLWNIPFLPFIIQWFNAILNGIEIHYRAKIGKGVRIAHARGIVIGADVHIGDECIIYSSVVLGVRHLGSGIHPKIGDRVILGTGAKVLGDVVIGEGAKIGANAVVLKDVPAYATAVGSPAIVIHAEPIEKVQYYG